MTNFLKLFKSKLIQTHDWFSQSKIIYINIYIKLGWHFNLNQTCMKLSFKNWMWGTEEIKNSVQKRFS